MKWRRAALLSLICALSACAEGGGRGTGIFTTVTGNVSSVQSAALLRPVTPVTGAPRLLAAVRELVRLDLETVASAQTDVEGINVAIEGTRIQARTDSNGDFLLQGDFEGDVTLVFQLPDGGGLARIALNVPAAGTLTLNNVRIDTQQGEAAAESQDVDFEAIITGIDCSGLLLTLVSSQESRNDVDQYILQLDTSSVHDAHGNPVPCVDLRVGEVATVEGMVNPDGTFGDATVVLQN